MTENTTPVRSLRTTSFGFCNDHFEAICEQSGRQNVLSAIGYLATWSSFTERYQICEIFITGQPGDMELVANYRSGEGEKIEYSIGAIWRDSEHTFSFHS